METGRVDRFQRGAGTILLLVIGVGLALLAARLIHIHSVMAPRLSMVAERQREGFGVLTARRGMIFDRRGRLIALSERSPDVFIDPSQVRDLPVLVDRLAPRLNLRADELRDRIAARRSSRYVVLASHVDPVTAEAVSALNERGLGIREGTRRVYPLGESLAHVIGWVGHDGRGMDGVEFAFDRRLRGSNGRREMIHDAARRAMRRLPAELREAALARDGGQIVLTIDAEIQRITEEALADAVTRFEAESGVAMVMSPVTGDVLAMANHPTFNANAPAHAVSAALRRNRAVTDPIEPGSTFKSVIVCGALDSGLVTRDEKIDCHNGSHYFGKRRITDTHSYGLLDIRGIIAHSSNIGMGVIAHRMGNEGLHNIVRRFGFGEATGLGLPGESPGLVRPLAEWNSYSTNSVAIGYEILVTPLQLATAIAAIVNDGILVRPRIVRQVLGPTGEVIESHEGPDVVRRVVPPDIARFVARDLMVAVMEDGSGRRVRAGPYSMLGKTGTPKLTFADRPGYEDHAYLSLFVGAAPATDAQLVVLVAVRRPNPDLGYYGGVVAAPAAGEIAETALRYLGVPPDGDSSNDRT